MMRHPKVFGRGVGCAFRKTAVWQRPVSCRASRFVMASGGMHGCAGGRIGRTGQTSLTGLLLPLPLHFALSTAALTRMPGISRRAPPCESRPVQYFCNQNHQLSWWYALCLKGINTGSPTRALNKIYISIKFTGYC